MENYCGPASNTIKMVEKTGKTFYLSLQLIVNDLLLEKKNYFERSYKIQKYLNFVL